MPPTVAQIEEKICSKEDRAYLMPIRYCYDWIGEISPYAKPAHLKLNAYMQNKAIQRKKEPETPDGIQPNVLSKTNSIDLFPGLAGLPWHTGANFVRQNKHWEVMVDGWDNVLEAFSADETAKRTPDPMGLTIAEIAAHELRGGIHKSARYIPLIFPAGNRIRSVLSAQMLALVFVIDEAFEIFGDKNDTGFLLSLFPPIINKNCSPKTPLQQLIWEIFEKMYDCDGIYGNGGSSCTESLRTYITRPKPSADYDNMDAYCKYRCIDGGMVPTWSIVKLLIGSYVDWNDPKLSRIVHLVANQILISNDIASYDKEKAHYLAGKAHNFTSTNAVTVMHRLVSATSEEAAKAMTYAYQLMLEQEIDSEIQKFTDSNEISEDDWRFVDTILLMMTGSIMAAVTIARYGGENSRLVSTES